MSHISLLVCDSIGANMAGSGIRSWELARLLSQNNHTVSLIVPPMLSAAATLSSPDFADVKNCATNAELRVAVTQTDVIVTVGGILAQYPFLAELRKPLVLDLYDPFLLAGLHKFNNRPLPERLALSEGYRRTHIFQIRAADYILCASEKQRNYWLGMLAVLGRVNPLTSDNDPTLRRLIDVVPFGLPAHPPRHERQVLKGVYKGIAATDKLILWGGGIWNWLDAPTLIRAMSAVCQHRDDVKLFFMGVKLSSSTVQNMPAAEQAISLSKQLGLYGRHVFFNDWTAYNERQNYLLEADIGVNIHLNHAETDFSFRTRMLDYLWASLPILTTQGDVLSEVVQKWGLGQIVKPGDVEGVAAAILKMLDNPNGREEMRPRFEQAAADYRWAKAALPLLRFCDNPHYAPDKTYLQNSPIFEEITTAWHALPGKACHAVKQQGINGLSRNVGEYLRWKLRR